MRLIHDGASGPTALKPAPATAGAATTAGAAGAAAAGAAVRRTARVRRRATHRSVRDHILHALPCLAALLTAALIGFLIIYILVMGIPHISPDLFSITYNSVNVSLMPALINTVLMTLLALAFAVPIGLGGAIFLAEYARRGNRLVGLIRIAADTLAGVPSIVYGLFGLLFFVTMLGWRMSLLAGACTLAIMILPLIISTAEEALRAVPDAWREGSFGLGAGRLRTVGRILLPSALPGILAGVILGIGRIVGESAALIYTAGTATSLPTSLFDSTRTLSVHMYVLASEGLHLEKTYATAVVLLLLVLLINTASVVLARRLSRKVRNV
ncbi:MAG: phosphate ABC transporter permease PstA [Coriobacteriales bacterium]|nr:phosphate ABC transporter permease PstA [Coriobacteriales bacterium]